MLVGFLIAGIGFIALILSLIGLQLSYLTWIDKPGRLFGFIIRITMIVGGLITVYLAQMEMDE